MITPKVRFRDAVYYNGRPEYEVESHGLEPGPAGIAFRSSGLINVINDDGSFDVTLVPWDNVVSFTHSILPETESDDDAVQ